MKMDAFEKELDEAVNSSKTNSTHKMILKGWLEAYRSPSIRADRMASALGVRKEVGWFAEAMEAKLKYNDAKKGDSWKKMSRSELWNLMSGELQEALDDCENINEFVDVANFCMMIWNNEIAAQAIREKKLCGWVKA